MNRLPEPLNGLIIELGQEIDLALMSLEMEPDNDGKIHYVTVSFPVNYLSGLEQEKQVIGVVQKYCKERGYCVSCVRTADNDYLDFRITRKAVVLTREDSVRFH